MKTTLKKIFLIMAVIITAMVCFAFSASALEAEGQCGDNVYWSYNADTKELIISGEGDMYPFYNFTPYDSYKNEVEKIIIKDGVTGIGAYAFCFCENLVAVDFADSIIRIGESSFSFSPKLNNVILPARLEVIERSAFNGCYYLNNIKIPDSVKIIEDSAFYDTAYTKNEKNWEKGVLYIDNHLINVKSNLDVCTIKTNTKSIAEYVFYNVSKLTDIYYSGSSEEWEKIQIGDKNYDLFEIEIHFNHTHAYSSTITKTPTCETTGITTYSCCCGVSYEEVTNVSNVHTGGTATCTSKAICTVCKQSYGNLKPHTYTTSTTKATLSKNGKQVVKCSCGAVKSSSTIYKIKTIKLSATTLAYNGKNQTPSVTIKDSKGKTISKSNYTVTYPKKRKDIGKYTVTVKFKGKYSGTKKLTFEIVPAKVTLSKVTAGSKQLIANWKTVSSVTGYEVVYSTSKKFTSKTTKKITVKGAKSKKATIKKLAKGKTYYVKVRAYKTVNKKPVYGAYSAVKSIKVK